MIALVLAFVAGTVSGLVVATVLGTAARESAVERSYWSGVRAASRAVSDIRGITGIPGRPLPHRATAGDGVEAAVEHTRRVR